MSRRGGEVHEQMTKKTYLAVLLATETLAIGLVSYHYASGFLALLLAPVYPLTLFAALLVGRKGRRGFGVGRLSPEAIIGYRARETRAEAASPAGLSRSIVERAEEIQRTLQEGPSEVQVEMCALGYRACVNDMITLTNLLNQESRNAGPIKRVALRRHRRRATDSLSSAREALPPGALRATHQEL